MSPLIFIVTALALIFYLWTGIRVGGGRARYKIQAPAMTGDPAFERLVRVQANTLEWLVVFVPAMWMFAYLVNEDAAAILGVVWIGGRILYAVTYAKDAAKRGPGFGIQALATFILLLGSLGGGIWSLVFG